MNYRGFLQSTLQEQAEKPLLWFIAGAGRAGGGERRRARVRACVRVLCGVSECVGRPTHLVRVSPFAECWAGPALGKGFCFF